MLNCQAFRQAPPPGPRLLGYVEAFSRLRVLTLGDLMLDCYQTGTAARLSPEAPVPVVELEKETWMPGGMGNACVNAAALGARVIPIGVIGSDAAGDRLAGELRSRGISDLALVRVPGRKTTLKTRILAGSQQVVRIDAETRAPVAAPVEESVLRHVREGMDEAHLVLVCDYGKGLLTPRVLAETLRAARAAGVPVCVDPKRADFRQYRGARVITPNLKEAATFSGIAIETAQDLELAAAELTRQAACGYLVVTLGRLGLVLFGGRGGPLYVPSREQQVFDVAGAGDTALAALGLALAAGAPIEEAVLVANIAAGVVVRKRGTAALTAEELIEELANCAESAPALAQVCAAS